MSWVLGVLARHPRLGLALKGAVAAALSWSVLLPFGGVASDYPYYAPLGAVVVVSSAVADSVRRGLEILGALVVGASTAAVTSLLPGPVVVPMVVAVAAGIVLAGWHVLGEAGSWVPVSALFVLVIGASDLDHYLLGYLGLTAVGVVVGTAVNALAPQVLLTPAHLAQARLRSALADQVDDLAARLAAQEPPSTAEWQERQQELEPLAVDARTLAAAAMHASRANWRARTWRRPTGQAYDEAQALVRTTTLLEELADLIAERDSPELDEPALGPDLRPVTAEALTATARLLRHRPSDDDGCDGCSCSELAQDSVETLAATVHDAARRAGAPYWGAATVVTSLQRIVAGLAPAGP